MAFDSRRRVIGLEIDTGTARAVEMSGTVSAPKLVNLGSVPLPDDAVKEGMVLEPEQVGDALKNLWQKSGFKEREVILGVSNQGVLVRHVTIPKVPLDKLKNVVRFQAQDHLPIPLESVVLDYIVLGESSASGDAEITLEILLVAARRDMLDNFLKALKIARIEPADIDVSSMALINLLPQKAMDMTIALVNISNGLNSILVSKEGKPRLARLGSVKISDLAASLGCSLHKIFEAIDPSDIQSSVVLENWINSLAVEVRSLLTYYQDRSGQSRVEGVLLNGRGAIFQGIAENLEDYLELPVRIFNYLEAYAPAKRRLLKSDFAAIEFSISAGLALRGLEV